MLQNLTELIEFIQEAFGINLNEDSDMETISGNFDLGQFSYLYEYIETSGSYLHRFELEAKITIDQDDQGSGETELEVRILIRIEDGGSYERTYGGEILIPLAEDWSKVIIFDLYFQSQQPSGSNSSSKLIVGQFIAQQHLEDGITDVSLGELVSQIAPGLGDLFPEELLSSFGLQEDLVLVIDCPAQTGVGKPKRSLLFSIGFNAHIAFNDLPLVNQLLPGDLLSDSEFGCEFLVALQTFSRQQLIAINYFLEEINSPLRIRPPCATTNELRRGASIGAHFNLGGYVKAWLTPLSRPKTVPPTGGGTRSLSGLPSGGNFRLVSSQNTTTPEEEFPITIADNGAWLTVQKTFGPMHFEQVGLVYKQGEIHLTPLFIIDIGRKMELTINGLSISSPLTEFTPTFNLDGFGLLIITRGLEIGGTFLVVEGSSYDEYLGTVVIGMKTGKGGKKALSISAIGSFAAFQGSNDFGLFLYLRVNYPFGGPPFFFVTGVSGGFGYNYNLKMPTLEEIISFPFVDEAVQEQNEIGPVDPADTATIIAEELNTLANQNYVTPKIGAGFGAIGLEFTCFKIIDGTGLVTIAIDSSVFELDLIATATLMLPTTIKTGFEPIAVAEMVMQARFAPSEGVLMIRGQLTPSSYFLSRECHLTGGYAYGLWFTGSRAGDFVVTQGGYHPRFQIPDYYPDVPRLGFSWQIDNNAFTTAQVYFALCGHGVMAGGMFAIAYKLGCIWAEFDAGVDVLLGWKPYHYDVSLRLHIRAGMGCVSVGVGADVRFWGPDFGCKFTITILLIKITIEIGDQSSQYPAPIHWDDFESAFLPAEEEVCSIAVVDGLTKQLVLNAETAKEKEVWVINPKNLELTTDSLIPAKQVLTWDEEQSFGTVSDFGVNSMGIKKGDLQTSHKVIITKDGKAGDAKAKFRFEAIPKQAPTAVWGNPQRSDHIVPPDVNEDQFIGNVCFGLRILPAEQPRPGETHEIGVEHLLYDTIPIEDNFFSWETLEVFVPDASLSEEQEKRDRIRDTIATQPARDNLLGALGFDTSKVNIDPEIAESFIYAPQVR
ncbi:MAG: DUF6603 domain-containing protein [Prochloraceae cyanobacterium]